MQELKVSLRDNLVFFNEAKRLLKNEVAIEKQQLIETLTIQENWVLLKNNYPRTTLVHPDYKLRYEIETVGNYAKGLIPAPLNTDPLVQVRLVYEDTGVTRPRSAFELELYSLGDFPFDYLNESGVIQSEKMKNKEYPEVYHYDRPIQVYLPVQAIPGDEQHDFKVVLSTYGTSTPQLIDTVKHLKIEDELILQVPTNEYPYL